MTISFKNNNYYDTHTSMVWRTWLPNIPMTYTMFSSRIVSDDYLMRSYKPTTIMTLTEKPDGNRRLFELPLVDLNTKNSNNIYPHGYKKK